MKTFYLHPTFLQSKTKWDCLGDFYEGDNDAMKKYLKRYAVAEDKSKEGKAAWEQRSSRTFYTNFCEPIISIWIAMLFKSNPDLSKIEKILTPEEQSNIDGFKTNIFTFIKEFARQYLTYGRSYISVDTPGVQSTSVATDRALNIRPYAEIWKPQEVLDWSINTMGPRIGKFNFLSRVYAQVEPREGAGEKPRISIYRKNLTYNSSLVSELYKLDVQQKEDKVLPDAMLIQAMQEGASWIPAAEPIEIRELNDIPVVRGEGRSWLKEVQPLAERFYNLDSTYDNILYYYGYPHITVATKETLQSTVPASETTIMQFPEGATVTQIGGEDPVGTEKNLERLRNQIFRVGLNQLRQMDGRSQQVQSADTIREEKENTIALAKETVIDIEGYINEFLGHWAAFKKTELPEAIELEKDFDTSDYERFLALYAAFADKAQKYPETAKAMDKKLVELADLDKEAQATALDEIENSAAVSITDQTRQDRFAQLAGLANAGQAQQ